MGQHHSTPMEDRPVVVVVGGGYAGIAAAKVSIMLCGSFESLNDSTL